MKKHLYSIFQNWCKQTVWIYSDPHFGDEELRAGVPGRPTDEKQLKMINSCVGRNDTFICLGDIGDIECIKKIRGYKVLICGNHDVGHTKYKRQKVKVQFDAGVYTREGAIEEMKKLYPNCKYEAYRAFQFHTPFDSWDVYADNMLFDEVYEGPLMIAERVILSHEPVDVPWAFNIHGHIHNRDEYKENTSHLNVCSDVIGYKPVNLNQLFKSGFLSKIPSIHRITIDKATKRKKKS